MEKTEEPGATNKGSGTLRKILASAIGMALAIPPMAMAQSAKAPTVADIVASPSRSAEDRAQDEGRKPAEVLAFSGIKRGDVVADFMAGGGYYTALLADIVGPKGTVYAINPQSFHRADAWEKRLAADRNIRPLVSDARAMQLAPGSVDAIFAHLVFHDLYFESERFKFPRLDVDFMLANWIAAVRPGGTVTIIDHVGAVGDTREIVSKVHRIDPQTVIRDMTRAGFKLVDQSDMLRRSDDDIEKSVFDESLRGKTDRFVMKFQKPV